MRTTTGLKIVFAIALFALIGCANGVLGDFTADDAGGASGVSTVVDAGGTGLGKPSPVADGGSSPGNGTGEDASSAPPSDDASTGGGADTSTPKAGGGGGDDAGSNDTIDAGPPVLVGKWMFDEGSGTSSADLSDGGHAAVFAGGATWTDAGKEGSGLALNGTTAYADVGVTLVDTSKSFSVLCWTKLNAASAWEIVASQDDVEGSLFGLKLRGDTNDYDFDVETSDALNPGFVVAQSTTSGVAQTWVHLAGVYDTSSGGMLKIYVNGALQANAAVGQSVLASTGHFVIGRGLYNGVTGSFFNGTLDELEVHTGALSSADVNAIFTAEQ